MNDHARELRRYAPLLGQPTMMLTAADEIERLAAKLEAAEKERDGLRHCFNEWIDKTEWVQRGINEGTISPKYLGLHRADVIASLLGAAEKERDNANAAAAGIALQAETLQAERDALRAETKNLREGLKRMCLDEDANAKEANVLRARIAEMEKQEPVGTAHAMPGAGAFTMACFDVQDIPVETKLYALPCAKGEEK